MNRPIPGQLDLTELVDDEHISGSMPAHPQARNAARTAFYTALLKHSTYREPRRRSEQQQQPLDFALGDPDE